MVAIGQNMTPTLGNAPAGGTAGRVLTKTSAADGAFAWSPLALGGAPLYASDTWHDTRYGASPGSANVSIAAGQCIYVPVYLYAEVSITAVAAVAATAATTTAYVGLHTTNTVTARPAALLEYGSFTNPAAGTALAYTLTTPRALGPGWIFVSIGSTAALTVNGLPQAYARTLWGVQATGWSATTGVGFGNVAAAAGVPTADPVLAFATGAASPVAFVRVA